jgi:hypothetical protein
MYSLCLTATFVSIIILLSLEQLCSMVAMHFSVFSTDLHNMGFSYACHKLVSKCG